MNVREHAEALEARIPKDFLIHGPDEKCATTYDRSGAVDAVEDAIRAAAAPLVAALRAIAAIDVEKDHGWDNGSAFGAAQDVADTALAAWDEK